VSTPPETPEKCPKNLNRFWNNMPFEGVEAAWVMEGIAFYSHYTVKHLSKT